MKVNIKSTNLDITQSLKAYINKKIKVLEKLVARFDLEGGVEMWLEVARVTKHHRKGDVFRAEADLRLPGKILRASEENIDIRAAIDIVQNKLRGEIMKYKTKRQGR